MDDLDKSLEERQQSNKDDGKVIDRLQTAINSKIDDSGDIGIITITLQKRIESRIIDILKC